MLQLSSPTLYRLIAPSPLCFSFPTPPRGQRPLARFLRCQSPAGGGKGVENPKYLFVPKIPLLKATIMSSLMGFSTELYNFCYHNFVPTGLQIYRPYGTNFSIILSSHRSSLITYCSFKNRQEVKDLWLGYGYTRNFFSKFSHSQISTSSHLKVSSLIALLPLTSSPRLSLF